VALQGFYSNLKEWFLYGFWTERHNPQPGWGKDWNGINPSGEEEVALFVQLKPQTVPSRSLKQRSVVPKNAKLLART
jgi:hypothetical protein